MKRRKSLTDDDRFIVPPAEPEAVANLTAIVDRWPESAPELRDLCGGTVIAEAWEHLPHNRDAFLEWLLDPASSPFGVGHRLPEGIVFAAPHLYPSKQRRVAP